MSLMYKNSVGETFSLEDKDSQPFAFGKYRNRLPVDLLSVQPDYLVWVGEKSDYFKNTVSGELVKAAKREITLKNNPPKPRVGKAIAYLQKKYPKNMYDLQD